MMRFVILLTLISELTFAQVNLVLNGDFENYNSCPNGQGEIIKAFPWFQPFSPSSSTDYYNSCSTMFGTPFNLLGFQNPRSGNGYAGLGANTSANIREYLEIRLLDSLKLNMKYCMRMYVSVPDCVDTFIDAIGGYFSEDSVLYSSPFFGVLNLPAQVQNTSGNVITDTAIWVLIEGEFTAAGGEQFLTIGNFKTDAQTTTIPSNSTHNSYFYIDDVSVTEGSCNVSIDEASTTNFTINISPNPVKDHFQIKVPEKNFSNLKYQVYAVDGRRIQDGVLKRYAAMVQCAEWKSGLYLVKVFDQNGHSSTVKVLKM